VSARTHHINGFGYFSALIALRQANQTLDSSQHSFCIKYVLTSFYAWADNARPHAVEELLLTDVDMAVNNVVFSQLFKTSGTYGWQPVTMTVIVYLYIQLIRPDTECKYLFVTNTGTKYAQGYVTKAIQSYYTHFGLDITINVFRKLNGVRF
jgi:hypothetical protein